MANLQKEMLKQFFSDEGRYLDDLHGDILEEMLCRLPFRSLLQARRVKKEWKSIIDTDFFKKLRDGIRSDTWIFSHQYITSIITLIGVGEKNSGEMLVVRTPLKMFLALCPITGLVPFYYESKKCFTVCNIFTRREKLLPEVTDEDSEAAEMREWRELKAHVRDAPYPGFLSCDLETKSYQVLRLQSRSDQAPYEILIFVYSSLTEAWQIHSFQTIFQPNSNVCYSAGKVYFFNEHYSSVVIWDIKTGVVDRSLEPADSISFGRVESVQPTGARVIVHEYKSGILMSWNDMHERSLDDEVRIGCYVVWKLDISLRTWKQVYFQQGTGSRGAFHVCFENREEAHSLWEASLDAKKNHVDIFRRGISLGRNFEKPVNGGLNVGYTDGVTIAHMSSLLSFNP